MTVETISAEHGPKSFSREDLNRIGQLLADAADEFSQHSCNDFTCIATSENKALISSITHWQAEQEGVDADPELLANVDETQSENEKIFAYDNRAMGYFAQRCSVIATDAAGAAELSSAELKMIIDLFDVMIDLREIDQEERDLTVDYTLSPTDEQKRFVADVIKRDADPGWERMVECVMQSDDEISVLGIAIMRYYCDRCKELAH
jgi:hypothetical protein